MWEKEAIEFWQSVPGGQYTEEEAQAKWLKHSAECKLRDHAGPEKKPLRLAVKIGDLVNEINSIGKKRRIVCEEKGNKKAKAEDIENLVQRMQMNHSSGVGLDMEDLQSKMVAAGHGGQAFSAIGMGMGSVDDIFGANDAGEETDGDADDADADGEEGSSEKKRKDLV